MDRYWTKIGIGALCIFGVGMTGITLARKGVAELKTAAFGPVEEVIRAAPSYLNFRLDGRRLGQVKSIEVSDQGGRWTAESVRLVVDLEEGRTPSDLAECDLGVDDMSHRRDAAFSCLSQDETSRSRLDQIGEVRFEPAGITRPLFVRARDIRRIERSELRGLQASVHAVGPDAIEGTATYDLMDRRGRREQGTVRLDASDGRAVIEVHDVNGNQLFRLRADEAGVSVNANEKGGASLLRLIAGQHGVNVRVR